MAWAADYCTTAELKAFIRINDAVDDAVLARAITAASRAIDRACNRQFGLVTAVEARYYTARWDRRRGRWVLDIDDLMTATGLLVKADLQDDASYTDAITVFQLKPVNAAALTRPWTQIVVHPSSPVTPTSLEDGVEVTARWGWTTVPTTIVQACLLQASRLASRRDSPYGIAGSPETGSELRLLAKVDPDVAVMLGTYIRHWGAV